MFNIYLVYLEYVKIEIIIYFLEKKNQNENFNTNIKYFRSITREIISFIP